MLSNEELSVQIKLIAQNAWRQETNTTVNSIVEYVVREAILLVNNAVNEQVSQLLILLTDDLQSLNTRLQELEDASTDGGVSQPQRNPQAQNKRGRSPAKAGAHDGAND